MKILSNPFSSRGEIIAVYLVSLLIFGALQFQSPYLPGTDGYYHIKFAYLMRQNGILWEFPWATVSLWTEHFSDKEFLYHLYLIPFTYFSNLVTGIKVATVLLAALAVTSFYAIVKSNAVRYPFFWYLALISSGAYFLCRANIPRPQVISITLALWAIHFVINHKLKALFAITFIYTWSYTAGHLPLIFAAIASLVIFFDEFRLEWKTPTAALAGFLAGMLIHPYFPDNFIIFWIQNFEILWKGAGDNVDLAMGGEFKAMSTKTMLFTSTTVVLGLISVLVTALWSPRKIDSKTKQVFAIALALFILTCIVQRFAEYSHPALILFFGMYFSPIVLEKFPQGVSSIPKTPLLLGLIILGILIDRSIDSTIPYFRIPPNDYKYAALYLKNHTEEDEVVFTCDWDDTPNLFYENHKNRYIIFLDPNFMYLWKPEEWKKWSDLAAGRAKGQTYDLLKNYYRVRFGVCTADFKELRKIIEQHPEMEIVLSSEHNYLFKVN